MSILVQFLKHNASVPMGEIYQDSEREMLAVSNCGDERIFNFVNSRLSEPDAGELEKVFRVYALIIANNITTAERFLRVLEVDMSNLQQGIVHLLKGMIAEQKQEFFEAIEEHLRAQSIFEQEGVAHLEGIAFAAIAKIHSSIGDTGGAIRNYSSANKKFLDCEDLPRLRTTTLCLAIGYGRNESWRQALDAYHELLEAEDVKNGIRLRDIIHKNLAAIYKRLGDYELSESYYVKALDIKFPPHLGEHQTQTMLGLMDLYATINNFQGAEYYHEQIKKQDRSTWTKEIHFQYASALLLLSVKTGDSQERSTQLQVCLTLSKDPALIDQGIDFLTQLEQQHPWVITQANENIYELKCRLYAVKLQQIRKSLDPMLSATIYYERTIRDIELKRQEERSQIMLDSYENTCNQIATALHDDVGQKLMIASLALQKASSVVGAEGAGLITQALEKVQQTSTEIRAVSHLLSAKAVVEGSLAGMIAAVINDIRVAKPEIEIYSFIADAVDEWPDEFKKYIYRASITLLQNSIRHGNPMHLDYQCIVTKNECTISINDDGEGFDSLAEVSGLGLKAVKAGCDRFNGTWYIDSVVGRGTFIELTFKR